MPKFPALRPTPWIQLRGSVSENTHPCALRLHRGASPAIVHGLAMGMSAWLAVHAHGPWHALPVAVPRGAAQRSVRMAPDARRSSTVSPAWRGEQQYSPAAVDARDEKQCSARGAVGSLRRTGPWPTQARSDTHPGVRGGACHRRGCHWHCSWHCSLRRRVLYSKFTAHSLRRAPLPSPSA